ncbi:alpha/beta fold hydrolase [Pseudomonas sp. UMAB-40]|uniref:alpha/beta fold hydrolase n=1 Tax=Pseudomonas sp. UMAB-40 TaxID=1365407 RepID=UPI001C58A519|nr:alpha/beta hydrolase [Pseudomonas sp. UMAB-40]
MLEDNVQFDTSDDALVKRIPGFESRFATVNGVTLHYVIGGKGPPLILLPGHPETWWAYHNVMEPLSKSYQVIVVDIRGMGSSQAPERGYDKKTMAEDIFQLIASLGFTAVNIAGHDIGAMVAFSLAANHPEVVTRLALLDVPHPDESWFEFSMLPREGTFGDKIDAEHPPYPWWFAFHQVQGLGESLLSGNGMRNYIAWLFNYMLANRSRIDPIDLAVYGDAYSSTDGIRAGHAWYRAWPRDINDQKAYARLTMPVLGLGAEHTGWHWLQITAQHATDFRLEKVEDSGHFIVMEQPEFVTEQLLNFFDEQGNQFGV